MKLEGCLGETALIVASTILPPDSFTSTWSPILYLGMVAASYHEMKSVCSVISSSGSDFANPFTESG
jgi:hypothetical protein